MKSNLIIVTGCFGAPTREEAQRLAERLDLPLWDLDQEIQRRDGRSIRRLVMMNGEHGYRNLEFEVLQELARQNQACVVACGDGVLYDEDSACIARESRLHIAGRNLTKEELWQAACGCEDSYHAFMSFGTEQQKRAAFDDLIDRQRRLFSGFEAADGSGIAAGFDAAARGNKGEDK